MKKFFVLLLLSVCFLLTGCGTGYYEETFFCMDTLCTVKTDTADTELINDCRNMLTSLDGIFSRHSKNSEVSKYNFSDVGTAFSDEAVELLGIASRVENNTDGAFTVFSGGLTSLWENAAVLPSADKVNNALATVKPQRLDGSFLEKNDEGTLLEFGGIAKGYACDKAVELLREGGASSGMVSFSSSIGVFGSNPKGQPWRIAVKDPLDTDKLLGYIELEDGFLSVSGDYERFYEIEGKKYNHIIDPKSGMPVDNGIHSTAVIAPCGAESDALSTAFFVMGLEEVTEKYAKSNEVKYLIVTDDGIFMNESMKKVFTEK